MILCQHLTKRFADFIAIDDVSFDIPSGICVLAGPNGAGKSTLLKLLTGLLAPDKGAVQIAGLDIAKDATLAWKRIIGVVPEDLGLFDSLTIKEHLELCGPIYGLTAKQTSERMEALIRVLGLEQGRDTFLDRCSHGMRKKTAFAMALLHNPRVLFLDEPFEGLDPVSSRTIQNLLTGISGYGATIFLTSHTPSIIERVATQILLIRGGRIVWSSPPNERTRPFEEIFFDLIDIPGWEDLPWLRSSPF
jgi:ABC-2 type transport system ATP-binding protein